MIAASTRPRQSRVLKTRRHPAGHSRDQGKWPETPPGRGGVPGKGCGHVWLPVTQAKPLPCSRRHLATPGHAPPGPSDPPVHCCTVPPGPALGHGSRTPAVQHNSFLNDKEMFPEKFRLAPAPRFHSAFRKEKHGSGWPVERVWPGARWPGTPDPWPAPLPFPSLTGLALGHRSEGK